MEKVWSEPVPDGGRHQHRLSMDLLNPGEYAPGAHENAASDRGVPAMLIGRSQGIEIGPMSGSSNVIFYLSQRGIVARYELIRAVLLSAKESNRILHEPEILDIVRCFENVTSHFCDATLGAPSALPGKRSEAGCYT